MAETTYYKHGAISVTSDTLHTRFKDEALNSEQSIIIGRDPLWMAAIIALGLVLFVSRFGDLLYFREQGLLIGIGAFVALAGYSTATLHIGQHMRERVVLVAPIWTIHAVRRAIAKAKQDRRGRAAGAVILDDAPE
ncbi:hypothetical protein JQV19_06175 [Sulfitobacter mediterraneus]|uniref:hypothetical protein n=1 Tax=Sulfitobacter mediterraneus TaxID=83219 RepID=UPI00193A41FE|nr:hypothetical protein [Sulfitobacter mediterraneus]MBM1556235.1 hypothetical protein [Sulfitobacter mediterraneus]MBM1567727.1 hypothetical protein [Sulfitobacter mediterraneus]MBM1571589.1 hypothetical protein [Sulfitobacter mediterraneus]MBM1575377.1 hypothetical protein [Sulfitobacter mediterraneus]MBM1579132.1 hypothetical protein [Sulfitobacter mediterraneus]